MKPCAFQLFFMFSNLLHYTQARPSIPPKGLRGPFRGPSPTNYAKFSFWRLQYANTGVKLSPPSKRGLLGVSEDSQTFSLSSTCAFSDNRCSTVEAAAAFQSGLAIVVQCTPSQKFHGGDATTADPPRWKPWIRFWGVKTKVICGRVLARYEGLAQFFWAASSA